MRGASDRYLKSAKPHDEQTGERNEGPRMH